MVPAPLRHRALLGPGLARTFWLDFDGSGYTVNDRVSGSLHKSWRLEMLPPTDLGRVTASGSDQLVSKLKGQEHAGVELREGLIALEADSRIAGSPSRVPAVSWDADFHQVSGTASLTDQMRLRLVLDPSCLLEARRMRSRLKRSV